MKLKVKVLNIATKGPLIAILNRADAQALNLEALDRIRIKKGNNEQGQKVIGPDLTGMQNYPGIY